MKTSFLFIFLVLAILISGCAAHQVQEGDTVGKSETQTAASPKDIAPA